jgi:hypothetical protein
VPRAKRIGIAKLQPADLLFFGSAARSRSPPTSTHGHLPRRRLVRPGLLTGVSLSPLSSPGTPSALHGPGARSPRPDSPS